MIARRPADRVVASAWPMLNRNNSSDPSRTPANRPPRRPRQHQEVDLELSGPDLVDCLADGERTAKEVPREVKPQRNAHNQPREHVRQPADDNAHAADDQQELDVDPKITRGRGARGRGDRDCPCRSLIRLRSPVVVPVRVPGVLRRLLEALPPTYGTISAAATGRPTTSPSTCPGAARSASRSSGNSRIIVSIASYFSVGVSSRLPSGARPASTGSTASETRRMAMPATQLKPGTGSG